MANKDLVYFTPNFNFDTGSPGVKKKISGQTFALGRQGWKVHMIGGNQFVPTFWGNNFVFRLLQYIANTARIMKHDHHGYQRALPKIKALRPSAVYIRYSYTSGAFVSFLKCLKSIHPQPKVLMEIATWPYDDERNRLELTTWEDVFFRQKLRGLIDRIVTFTDEKNLLGISTITTRNGIDVDSVTAALPQRFDGNRLSLIGVANLAFWTGYDRLLAGLSRYNQGANRKRIEISIVGDGQALQELKIMTKAYGLESFVRFCGKCEGKELDGYFIDAHLAIGNLANHRRNLGNNSDLKNRDYCSRGIPFVTSTPDDGFPADFPFSLQVPGNDDPIDFAALVSFYEELRVSHPDYSDEMRVYAKEKLDWSVMMQPVASYLMEIVDDKRL